MWAEVQHHYDAPRCCPLLVGAPRAGSTGEAHRLRRCICDCPDAVQAPFLPFLHKEGGRLVSSSFLSWLSSHSVLTTLPTVWTQTYTRGKLPNE